MLRIASRLAQLALLAAFAALAFAPAAAAAGSRDGSVALVRGWEHLPDPGDQGVALGLPGGQAGTGWKPVSVPHVFDPRPDKSSFGGTVGWYRTTFAGPDSRPGGGWALRFAQVRRTAKVWLNGRALGAHADPYTPFELRAYGLKPGQPNTLVVRVDNRKGAEPREGWWNWGGITRPVSLAPQGAVSADDVGLLPRRGRAGRWEVLVDGWLENRSQATRRASLSVRLSPPAEGEASAGASPSRVLRPGERVRLRFAVPIRGRARVWSPEKPDLYAAAIATRVGGRTAQVDRERVGLRTVAVRGGTLRLNGKVLDLRGASIQEDMDGRGPVLTDADIDTTIDELEAVGANVTRAHYLLDERLLDRFDEEGILVWGQAPVYHRDVALRTTRGRSRELDVVRNTILETRGHPSVITNSVANELSPEPDRGEDRMSGVWLRNAAALARDLAPGVPVSVDLLSYPRIPAQKTYDAFDMLGVNSYYGWYEGKADRSTANLGDLAAYLRNMHAKYPRQALVMTEFGAEATEDGPAARKQTYAFQKLYVQRNLAVVDRLGFMGGAIYWTLREFAVKPDWDGGAHPAERDAIHNKALIAYDGARKPAWDAARSAFRATPLYRDDPRAVARAELANPRGFTSSALLVSGVLGSLLVLLGFYAWCVRDIWRAGRPDPGGEAEVVALRRVA